MPAAADLLRKLPGAFRPDAAGDTDCTVQFSLSTPMHVVIRNGTCAVREGDAAAPDVDVAMDDDDFVALMKGELNGMTAYMTGKLQLEGDLMLAQRMFGFFDSTKL